MPVGEVPELLKSVPATDRCSVWLGFNMYQQFKTVKNQKYIFC